MVIILMLRSRRRTPMGTAGLPVRIIGDSDTPVYRDCAPGDRNCVLAVVLALARALSGSRKGEENCGPARSSEATLHERGADERVKNCRGGELGSASGAVCLVCSARRCEHPPGDCDDALSWPRVRNLACPEDRGVTGLSEFLPSKLTNWDGPKAGT